MDPDTYPDPAPDPAPCISVSDFQNDNF
jgi:hypothetical protein